MSDNNSNERDEVVACAMYAAVDRLPDSTPWPEVSCTRREKWLAKADRVLDTLTAAGFVVVRADGLQHGDVLAPYRHYEDVFERVPVVGGDQ